MVVDARLCQEKVSISESHKVDSSKCIKNLGLEECRREIYLADAAAEVGGPSLVTLQ